MKRFFPLLILLLISCAKEEIKIDEYAECKLQISEYHISKADPVTGLIEFDIIPYKQNKAVQVSKLWTNNTVPYFLDNDLGEDKKNQIKNRIKNLESLTYIKFIEYSNTTGILKDHKGGIHFRSPTNPFAGNSSFVGMQGGIQDLTLIQASLDYVIDHEILHALGFEHEIKRKDRDENIIMLWDNIPPNPHIRRQFEIDATAALCGNYDLESVMHYGSFIGGWIDAEETNRPVYTDLKGNIIPQPTEMSAGDIQTIKTLYPKIK